MPINFRDHKPKTLTEAIDILYDAMTDDEKKSVRENGAITLHHGFGTALRNNWGLWSGSKLKQFFEKTYGIKHADDMSGLILEGLDARLNGLEFDVLAKVESYKQHWIDQGVKP